MEIKRLKTENEYLNGIIDSNITEIVQILSELSVDFHNNTEAIEKNSVKIEENLGVRLQNGKYPEVFWNGVWVPICGHWFWDNNFGATLFCKQLGFKSGIIKRNDQQVEADAIRIGRCTTWDNIWLHCSGGRNNLDVGGIFDSEDCSSGHVEKFEIDCKN